MCQQHTDTFVAGKTLEQSGQDGYLQTNADLEQFHSDYHKPERDFIVQLHGLFNKYQKLIIGGLLFFLAVVVFGLLIYRFIFSTNTLAVDFYTFWLAGRAFLLEQTNPYSTDVSLLSQIGIIGRAAQPGDDQLAFAYPVHSLWLILPTIWMDFPLAASIWFSYNVLAMMTALFVMYRGYPVWVLLSFGFQYMVVFTLMVGNFSLIVGVLYLLIYSFLMGKKDLSHPGQFICGLLLVMMTIKPQVTLLILLVIFLHSFRTRYFHVFVGFGVGLLVFILPTIALNPQWPFEWVKRLVEYSSYMSGRISVAFQFAKWIFRDNYSTWAGYGMAAVLLGFSVIIMIRWWNKQTSTLFLLTWVAFFALMLNPLQTSNGQVFLLIPLFVWTLQNGKFIKIKRFVWFGIMVVFWIIFYLDVIGWMAGAIDTLPFIFYAGWICFMFFEDRLSIQPGFPMKDTVGSM